MQVPSAQPSPILQRVVPHKQASPATVPAADPPSHATMQVPSAHPSPILHGVDPHKQALPATVPAAESPSHAKI